MRLIDLDDDRHCYVGNDGEYERWNIAPEAHPIDALPVVRCKYCKWYKTKFCKMDRWTDLVTVYVAKADDYCSYGKRREKDEL